MFFNLLHMVQYSTKGFIQNSIWPVNWKVISIVLAVIGDVCTIVPGTGYAACTYYWNKGATALSNIHAVIIVIDDVGIVLSCNIQDDMFLYY